MYVLGLEQSLTKSHKLACKTDRVTICVVSMKRKEPESLVADEVDGAAGRVATPTLVSCIDPCIRPNKRSII